MSRDIHDDIKTTVEAEANVPIELCELYLDDFTLRYTKRHSDVEFPTGSGIVYTARAFSFGNIRTDIRTGMDSVEVIIDNVDGYFSSLIVDNRYEVRGKKLKLIKVFENHLDNADYSILLFGGKMDSPRVDQYDFIVTVKSELASLNRECPKRKYQPICPWVFGDGNCDPGGMGIKKTFTGYVWGIYGRDKFNVTWDGTHSFTKNYFMGGYITMTSGSNNNVTRKIKSSESGGYIEVYHPFPEDIKRHDTFSMVNGCDKTKQNCMALNNIKNFGGVLFAVEDWTMRSMVINY